jgi:hypothetical protein
MTTPKGSTQRIVALRVSIVRKMADEVIRKRFHIPDKEKISFIIEVKDAKNTKKNQLKMQLNASG